MSDITFVHPWVLLGLVAVPLMILWWIWRYRKQDAAVQHSAAARATVHVSNVLASTSPPLFLAMLPFIVCRIKCNSRRMTYLCSVSVPNVAGL